MKLNCCLSSPQCGNQPDVSLQEISLLRELTPALCVWQKVPTPQWDVPRFKAIALCEAGVNAAIKVTAESHSSPHFLSSSLFGHAGVSYTPIRAAEVLKCL